MSGKRKGRLNAFEFMPETEKKLFELAMADAIKKGNVKQISRVKILVKLIDNAYKKLNK